MKKPTNEIEPPKLPLRFFQWYCHPDFQEDIEGDLRERFSVQVESKGVKAANWKFLKDVFQLFRPGIIRSVNVPLTTNSFSMLKNYGALAYRLFIRYPLISFINVLGLSLALAGSLLILMFILDEISYDRHNANADRIYRVTRSFLSADGSETLHLGLVAPPIGPLLQNDFADIDEIARIHRVYRPLRMEHNDGNASDFIDVKDPFYAEPSIFTLFDIPLITGTKKNQLERPFTALISESVALNYFGNINVIGRIIKSDDADFEITGVYEDFPNQSHWHPDLLFAFNTLNNKEIYGRQRLESHWGNNDFSTYILVNDQFDVTKVESEFPDFLDRHMGTSDSPVKPSSWTKLSLQPLTSIHLHSQLDHEIEANGSIDHIYIMGAIGLFLLIIAIFNFINLTTARSNTRGKEIGLRKVLGAFKTQLIAQYLSEATFVVLIASIVAVIFVGVSLSWLNDFTGKYLEMSIFLKPQALLISIGLIIVIGVLAGFYPALLITRLNTVRLMRQQLTSSPTNQGMRKGLVIFQFTISIMMIASTIIVYNQLDFLTNRDLGYSKDQIIRMKYDDDFNEKYPLFYHELTRYAAINEVGRSSLIPTGRLLDYQETAVHQGDSLIATSLAIKDVRIDEKFLNTYQVPIVSGRNFTDEIKSDDSIAFIINEAAANMIGWTNEEAIGQLLQKGSVKGTVIGVVRDFHFESLHESIVPILFHNQQYFNHISIQVSADDMQGAINHLEKVWKEFMPNKPFEFSFLSERYKKLYTNEERQSELFMIFTGLAIVIASLGLFGLTSFTTLQRVKEIGIRKTLGASTSHILGLLSSETALVLVIANAIAWPLAWYMMDIWLNQFAYGIELGLWMFLLAGLSAAFVAFLTISYQAIKTANANPINSLRDQ